MALELGLIGRLALVVKERLHVFRVVREEGFLSPSAPSSTSNT